MFNMSTRSTFVAIAIAVLIASSAQAQQPPVRLATQQSVLGNPQHQQLPPPIQSAHGMQMAPGAQMAHGIQMAHGAQMAPAMQQTFHHPVTYTEPVHSPSAIAVQSTQQGCPRCYYGFDCSCGGGTGLKPWHGKYRIDFERYGQGEYVGPPRLAHLAHYQVRVGDTLQFTYSLSRRVMHGSYRIGVGDQLMIESLSDPENLNRGTLEQGIEVQQDGTISVRILGRVHAVGLTMDQLRELLEKLYKAHYKNPKIDVSPVRTNVTVEDIRSAIGGAGGFNEQSVNRIVTPDGSVTLPKIGQIQVQGLGIDEIKQEINLRYQVIATGLDVEVALAAQAPHFVSVLGEVEAPGRFEMQGPTTVLGAIALAGGRQAGANLRQVVVFRRADDWRLLSTVLDVRQAVIGKDPLPYDEIWLRDGDVVILPASPIQRFDNFVSLVFTQGIYGVVPFTGFDLVEAVNGFTADNDN